MSFYFLQFVLYNETKGRYCDKYRPLFYYKQTTLLSRLSSLVSRLSCRMEKFLIGFAKPKGFLIPNWLRQT